MKVAVVSAGSPDYSALADVTQPTRARYAEKHGYDCYFFETTKERGDSVKGDCFFALYGKGYDVMMWADLDSQIMNGEWTIEWIIEKYMDYPADVANPSAHFLWGYDHAGPNSGVYIVRFTPEGAHWMDRAYATMRENGLADETAMEILATTHPFKDYVRACPGVVLNSYPYHLYGWDKYPIEYQRKLNAYEPGCFILHLPGIPNEQRIPLLKKYLESAT